MKASDTLPSHDAPDGPPNPSKSQRKKAMHALQDLGESLVKLDDGRLSKLGLSDTLRDALIAARGITKWEARRRHLQYIGRLMREIDPEPIHAQLAHWAAGPLADTTLLHELERTRADLLENPQTLDALSAQYPGLDRAYWLTLIERALLERSGNHPPKAYRHLFRELRALHQMDNQVLDE